MTAVRFTSADAEQRYAALVAVASSAASVVGLDFNGTLAPIVDDPDAGHPPRRARVLVALAGQVRAVAVITGRPARQVLELGGLEEVGAEIGGPPRVLRPRAVRQRALDAPPPPGGLAPAARGAGAFHRETAPGAARR